MKFFLAFLFPCILAFSCTPDLDDQPAAAAAGAGLRPVPDSLFQLATSQLDSLKFEAALQNFRSAEPLFLQAENWEKTIACRRSQAYCLWWSHRSPEAVVLCEQTLPEAKNRLGDSHPEVAKMYTILGNVHADKRTENDFRLCLDYFQKALDATRQHFGDPHPALADCYERFGIAYFLADDYANGIAFYEKALTYLPPPSPENATTYVKIYNNLGLNYNGMGLYARSLECFENALRINEEVRNKRDGHSAKFLKNIAQAQLQLGDFDEATLAAEQALALQKQVGEPGSKLEAYVLSTLGDCHKAAGDYPAARRFFEQCLPFWTTGKRDDVNGLKVELQNLGEVCLLQNDPAAALGYFRQALQTIDSVHVADSYNRVAPLVNLGKAHALGGNSRSALDAWNRALRIAINTVGQRHPVPGQIRQLVAALHFKNGDRSAARQSAEAALQSFTAAGVNEVPLAKPGGKFSLPFASQTSDWGATADLLTLLGDLSISEPETESSEIAPRRSLGFYQASLVLHDSLKMNLASQAARQEAQKKVAALAERAIGCVHRLRQSTGDTAWLADAFVFFEKSKSAQLAASLREDQAQTAAGIPVEILRREQWLKSECAYLRRRWQNPDPAAAGENFQPTNWQTQYFQARRQLDSLVGSLEKNYPAYFRRKHDASVAPLAGVRQRAQAESAAVLEYFWGDSSVYLLAVPPGGGAPRLERLGSPAELEPALATLRKIFQEYQPGSMRPDHVAQQEFQAFCNASQSLHKKLGLGLFQTRSQNAGFENGQVEASAPSPVTSHQSPVASHQSPITHHPSPIVIVPDGLLNYLPFAALLERQPAAETLARLDWRSLPYLLRSQAVQMVPSATFWLENQSDAKGEGGYLGFAPAYENERLLAAAATRSDSLRLSRNWGDAATKALPTLHFNRQEVERTSALAGGKIFPGEAATEAVFKKNAPEARILHCAMHALSSDADPQNAALIFSQSPDPQEDGRLRAWEICNLPLRADLAVLSACNTGAGRLLRGEGVMSLAHAFQFAGCRSVMMSLWRANDAATEDVTVGFFQRLKMGERKSQALRQSVLRYLSEVKSDEWAHPSCWANFVVTGSDEAVAMPSNGRGKFTWAAIFAVLAGAGIWLFWRHRR